MSFDLVLRNIRIVDGAGNTWYRSDMAITKGKIAAISRSIEKKAEKTIDLHGLVATPGFIDIHSHTDRTIFRNKYGESALRQGITTTATGMCGGSSAPLTEEAAKALPKDTRPEWRTFKEFVQKVSANGVGINILPFVGHNTIRSLVIGPEGKGGERTEVTSSELNAMKRYVDEAMKAGASGLSTGLIYPPGRNATTEEIVNLCKVVAKYRGLYFSHIRNEGDTLLEAVVEAAEIGRIAGIPVHMAHFKSIGRPNRGKVAAALQVVEEARREGVDITCDLYPYSRSATSNLMNRLALPREDIKPEKLLAELRDKSAWIKRREAVVKAFAEAEKEDAQRKKQLNEAGVAWPYYTGLQYAVIVYSKNHPEYVDKTVTEVAEERSVELVDAIKDLVVDDDGLTRIGGHMFEDDVRTVLKHPISMVGTDSSGIDGFPESAYIAQHPRTFGSYPRILGKYVREEKLLPLEEAVRKMTSYPAQRLRLGDRGLLRPGCWADIVVFDPETIGEVATFAEPNKYPIGIEYVVVNGVIAVEKGKLTKVLAGKVLARGK